MKLDICLNALQLHKLDMFVTLPLLERYSMKLFDSMLIKSGTVTVLVSLVLFVLFFIITGGNGDDNSNAGGLWWLYLFFGMPLFGYGILALFLGLIAQINMLKKIQIGKNSYGLGSLLLLTALLACLVVVFIALLR
jgi:hypothetical protein